MSSPSLDILMNAWEQASVGHGNVIWVRSLVGTGKSVLLTEFFQEMDRTYPNVAVVFCRCGDTSIVSSSDHGELEALIAQIAEGARAFGTMAEDSEEGIEVGWCLPGIDFLSASIELAGIQSNAVGNDSQRIESHLGVLFDVAQHRPLCLVLDDVNRTDERSKALLDAIDKRLSMNPSSQILIVASETIALKEVGTTESQDEPAIWAARAARTIHHARTSENLVEFIKDRISHIGTPCPEFVDQLLADANHNFLVVKALLNLSEQYGAFEKDENEHFRDPKYTSYPQFEQLKALGTGNFPNLPADLYADLQQASILGRELHADLLSELWNVPQEAAQLRIDALASTGMVLTEAGTTRFLSAELASQFKDRLAYETRTTLHAKVAVILRHKAVMLRREAERPKDIIDVTDTWLESRKREQVSKREFDLLWASAHHFSEADDPTQAAECAVTLTERLFETSGGQLFMHGKGSRREDRERRHRIYGVLTEAENQINRAVREVANSKDNALLAIKVRLFNLKSRFKEVMGDFIEAKRFAELAVELSTGNVPKKLRVNALRIQLEVHYASGDAHAARLGLSRLLSECETLDPEDAIELLSWLAEAVGRWEWYGLQEPLFRVILSNLEALQASDALIAAQLEWVSAAAQAEQLDTCVDLITRFTDEAKKNGQQASFAEQLVRFAGEINHHRIETHFDLYSGEYYSAELLNDEPALQLLSLGDRLSLVHEWFRIGERLADESQTPLSQLRVAAVELEVLYESRERFLELLERWRDVDEEHRPSGLAEVVYLLDEGYYSTDEIERLTHFILDLSRDLELYQVIGDTIYEALERETPGFRTEYDQFFPIAEAAYQEVDDAYGLLTLLLVHLRKLKGSPVEFLEMSQRISTLLNECEGQLSFEQRAFVHYRLGRVLLQDDESSETGIHHLEHAIELYNFVGEMQRVQNLAETLREIYKQQGDLSRYRSLRERFGQFDLYSDGVDPLGLELKIEHLLALARSEEDEIKSIEMVEDCVQLFSRVPDGTTRIDECFVEISKICRRRAERSETEAGHHDWTRRSLEAVQIAVSINRSLGNFFRVFEEYHELFEDLLSLGLFPEYIQQRRENRELAFAVGNVAELVYLFEECLQFDGDESEGILQLGELRTYFEGLNRYMVGLGAEVHAQQLTQTFVSFLLALGETELAEHYKGVNAEQNDETD